MNSKVVTLVVVVIAVIGGWYIYKQNNALPGTGADTQSSPTTVNVELPAVPSTQTQTQSVVKEFTVSGANFYFAPNTLSVNKGDTVKINFANAGGIHDLVIDGYNVRTSQISGGQSQSITFVADKAGTFEYYCSVGSHRQMGMKGTLTVN